MKWVYLGFVLCCISSCSDSYTSKELLGNYVPTAFVNTKDTIRFLENGIYERVVYNKNGQLALKMKSFWSLDAKCKLRMDHFYLNFDDDLISHPHLVNDTAMVMSTVVESKNGGIQFCVGYQLGENCYRKLR